MAGESAGLMSIRLFHLTLAGLLLSGCTFFFDVQDSVQPDQAPDSQQQRIIFGQIQKITQSMKQIDQSEVSGIGPNAAESGPEKWTVCSRGNFQGEFRFFTFFVKGETVTNWRPAVINDKCETRSFMPFERGN